VAPEGRRDIKEVKGHRQFTVAELVDLNMLHFPIVFEEPD
jgi:hypothetical protein